MKRIEFVITFPAALKRDFSTFTCLPRCTQHLSVLFSLAPLLSLPGRRDPCGQLDRQLAESFGDGVMSSEHGRELGKMLSAGGHYVLLVCFCERQLRTIGFPQMSAAGA